jgi:hypothetical protein
MGGPSKALMVPRLTIRSSRGMQSLGPIQDTTRTRV